MGVLSSFGRVVQKDAAQPESPAPIWGKLYCHFNHLGKHDIQLLFRHQATPLFFVPAEIGSRIEGSGLCSASEDVPVNVLCHGVSDIIRLLRQAELLKTFDCFLWAQIGAVFRQR